jgi:hypothetical protein
MFRRHFLFFNCGKLQNAFHKRWTTLVSLPALVPL